jgi:chromate reductase
LSTSTSLLGLSGSLRRGAHSTAVLLTLREQLAPAISIVPFDIGTLPLYNADLAGDALEPVRALKSAISASQGLVIVTPEYNYGVPGVLKNALDWASRPAFGSPLAGKPVAIAGASTGLGGTRRAQEHLCQALAFPRASVLDEPRLLVPEAYGKFDEDGRLVDEHTIEALGALLEALRRATVPELAFA